MTSLNQLNVTTGAVIMQDFTLFRIIGNYLVIDHYNQLKIEQK